MKVCFVVGFVLLILMLSACGGSGNSGVSQAPSSGHVETQTQPTQNDNPVQSHKLSDYYWIDDIRMPSGRTLVCIEAYAMTCNWEAYNHADR